MTETLQRPRPVAGIGGDRFVMTWPVLDKKRPVAELVEEARGDLRQALRDLGVVAVSTPFFSMSHGRSPQLKAELRVRFA